MPQRPHRCARYLQPIKLRAAATLASLAPLLFHGPTALPASTGSTESRVAIAPGGTQYVVSAESTGGAPSVPLTVYASHDGGATWRATAANPVQNSPSADVDIVVTRTGRVVVVVLDGSQLDALVSYSDDGGKTWTASGGDNQLTDQDRPWLAVGPDDPTTHQPRVYLLFHNLFSGNATEQMFVETSTDDGATFGPPVPLTTPGSDAFNDLQCGDTTGPSSINVNPKTGRLYAFWDTRHGPAGGCGNIPQQPVTIVAQTRIWVATSPDNSLGSWTTSLAVDDSAKGNIVGMQVSPGWLDTAGNVYVVYPESPNPFPDFTGAAVKLISAPADLSHWSAPITIAPEGQPGGVLTHVVAGSPGNVGVAWLAGKDDGHGAAAPGWYLNVAHVTGALSGAPTVSTQQVQSIPAFRGTATQLMGWCGDSDPTQQSVPGCLSARASDMWGVGLDASCQMVITWSTISAASDPTIGASVDKTWVASQYGGPTLCGSVTSPPSPKGMKGGPCQQLGGRAQRGRLGPLALGMTRARVHAAVLYMVATRGRRDFDFLCSRARGLRAGYRGGRVVLLLSSYAGFSVGAVHPGASLPMARAALHRLSGPYRIGANDWYLGPAGAGGVGRAARPVLKTRGGRVQEIGIASARLTSGAARARKFLAEFR